MTEQPPAAPVCFLFLTPCLFPQMCLQKLCVEEKVLSV